MDVAFLKRWWCGLDRWERLALVVWVAVLLPICCRVLADPQKQSVLPIFTASAQRWLAGADLYAPVENLDNYQYSPLVAVLMVPVEVLPDRLGAILWRLFNAGFYLAALTWWISTALPIPLSKAQRAGLLLLIVPLSIGSINNGQSNALVIGLLLLASAGVVAQRWNLSSVCLAVACLFKVYPLALAMLLAALYPRRLLPRLVLALLIGLAMPFLFGRPDYVIEQYGGWIHYLRTYNRDGWPIDIWFRDVRLLSAVWLRPLSSKGFLAAEFLSGAGMAGLCWAAQRSAWPRKELLFLTLALGCCWMMAFGPATESCTFIMLAPVLALMVLESWMPGQSPTVRLLVSGSYGLLATAQMSCWFPNGRAFTNLGVHSFAVLVLLGCLVGAALPKLRRQPVVESTPLLRAAA